MNLTEVVVNGTLSEDGSLQLDEKPGLPAGRVQIVVKPAAAAMSSKSILDIVHDIWDGQNRRGHVPRSKEEIDEELRAMRDEWDSHQSALEQLQISRPASEQPPC